jgi:adenylate kinase family enzyme
MERVLVIGSSGAGKTRFSLELARLTGLPIVHLDKEYWNEGWVVTPREVWREEVRSIVERERWILDGTFAKSLDLRLPRADTVVFLDYPRYLCMLRMAKRVLSTFGQVRCDMAPGCPERFDWVFTKWVWNYRRDQYPLIETSLKTHFAGGTLIVLKSPRETDRFLKELGRRHSG